MKEIFKEYGGAVIAATVALLILTVFFGISLSGKTGMDVNLGGILADHTVGRLTDIEDSAAFAQYQNLGGTEFGIQTQKPIYAGRNVWMSEYLLVQDQEGNGLCYGIKGIRDENGIEIPVSRIEEGGLVCFEQPGIYRIYLQTQDDSVKVQEAVLAFPVQAA